MRRLVVGVILLAISLLGSQLGVARAAESDPAQQLAALNQHVTAAISALSAGDLATARAEYTKFDDGWFTIEDGIRDTSRDSYRAIEQTMGDIKFALKQQPVDTAAALTSLRALEQVNQSFIALGGSAQPAAPAAPSQRTIASTLPMLDAALAATTAGDLPQARDQVEAFRAVWPDVEGIVAAKDGAAYQQSEALQAQASAELKAGQAQAAAATIGQLKTLLTPYATTTLRYGVFEATSILLREGLEALLIIAALLAFLQKSGNADKRGWIWAGGAAGVAASIVTAVAIQLLFSAFVTGANRELVEGVTGLIAAALLFYVSYWLHSKTHMGGWQRYLKDKTDAALARGSLISLAALAFLSVFREGAETALFYIGIAPAIATRDLLLGLGIGTALLTVVGTLVLGLGKRIPLKPFFQVTSLLIWYLGFKFIGSGIRALQVARVVPETGASWLPSSDLLGLYPTWETTIPQLILLAIAIGVVVWTRATVKQNARIQMTTQS